MLEQEGLVAGVIETLVVLGRALLVVAQVAAVGVDLADFEHSLLLLLSEGLAAQA